MDLRLDKEEIEFIKESKICRIATISKTGWPQNIPVIYVFYNGCIYFSTDYETKKFKNIKENNRVSVVVDSYTRQPKGITIQGTASILEKGEEFRIVEKIMEDKFSYYKSNPFKEGDVPIIKITPRRKLSWGFE